jgi:hypothetical protein
MFTDNGQEASAYQEDSVKDRNRCRMHKYAVSETQHVTASELTYIK